LRSIYEKNNILYAHTILSRRTSCTYIMVKAEKGVGGCACNGISLKLGTQAKLRVWFEAADALVASRLDLRKAIVIYGSRAVRGM